MGNEGQCNNVKEKEINAYLKYFFKCEKKKIKNIKCWYKKKKIIFF